MLKMLLDPMGGIAVTNDGNAILREIDVSHPAAKNMIELSRAQDEEVGDGTTSVIILGASCVDATVLGQGLFTPRFSRIPSCLLVIKLLHFKYMLRFPLRGGIDSTRVLAPRLFVMSLSVFVFVPSFPCAQLARSWPPRSPSC